MRKISLEEHDILAIFCAKKLKTKLGTFIRKTRTVKEIIQKE